MFEIYKKRIACLIEALEIEDKTSSIWTLFNLGKLYGEVNSKVKYCTKHQLETLNSMILNAVEGIEIELKGGE